MKVMGVMFSITGFFCASDLYKSIDRSENAQAIETIKKECKRERDFVKKNQESIIRAIELNNVTVLKAFLACGMSPDQKFEFKIDKDITSEGTLLRISAEYGEFEVEKLLIDSGAKLESKDADGLSPLAYFVRANRIKTVKYLLERKANVNSIDNNGESPLMHAVNSGSIELIMLLLAKRPNLRHVNSDGKTAGQLLDRSTFPNEADFREAQRALSAK